MKIRYSLEKEELLNKKRNISFKLVIQAIDDKKFRIIKSPKPGRENQYLIIFNHNNYPHVCPFVIENNWTFFLKTIYPDRNYKNFIN